MNDAPSKDRETRAVLKVTDLAKSFGDSRVLTGVSLTLSAGEILGVIGPSGGGKTTLLRCIDLIDEFESGTIEYLEMGVECLAGGELRKSERNEGDESGQALTVSAVRRRLGFVFQTFNLWEDRSVLENMCLAPKVVLGETMRSAEKRALTLLDRFGLANRAGDPVWKLSGGQRQRVAIVRALMMSPRILLCDEITSALDPILAYEVLEAILALRDEGIAMIVVTHHIDFATRLCDRLAFLDGGKLLQVDTPERVVQAPAAPAVEKFLRVIRAVG